MNINILCQLTLLGGLFTLALVLFKSQLIKKFGGSWYYYIWLTVLAVFCIPFKIDLSLSTSTRPYTAAITVTEAVLRQNIYKGASAGFDTYAGNMPEMNLGNIISILYLLGLGLMIFYYLGMYASFREKIGRTARKIVNEQGQEYRKYVDCLDEVCDRMNIKRKIGLMVSGNIHTPIFTGILRPAIILPEREYDTEELSFIFRHELTHYKRKDMLYKSAALAVHCLHWFNPLSYMALKAINEACEYSCDEAVTKNMDMEERRKYGGMLLKQAAAATDKPVFAAGFSRNGKQVLKRRFEIIMSDKKYKYAGATAAFICALVVISSFTDLKPVRVFADEAANSADTETAILVEDELESDTLPVTSDTSVSEINVGIESDTKISEEEAVKMAKLVLEKYYKEADELFADASYYEEGSGSVQPEGWFIRLFPEGNDRTHDYAAWIDPSGNIITVTVSGLWENAEIIGQDDVEEIEGDINWAQRVTDVIKSSGDSAGDIYFGDLEACIGEKSVAMGYETDDGMAHTVRLTYPDKELKSVSVQMK